MQVGVQTPLIVPAKCVAIRREEVVEGSSGGEQQLASRGPHLSSEIKGRASMGYGHDHARAWEHSGKEASPGADVGVS